MRALLAVTVVLPFPFALVALALGGLRRVRGALCAAYSLASVGLNLAILNVFLVDGGGGWGALRLDRLNLPIFLVLNLLSAAVLLYAGFRRSEYEGSRGGLLLAAMLAACGLAGLAVLARGLLAFSLLWEAVTAAALVGLLATGRGKPRKRLLAFLPWLISDALFLGGAALTGFWLKESVVLVRPPLTSGSEAQVVVIMLLFLASALLRLAVFPLNFWVGELLDRADPAWSALFLGAVNFLMAGFRLLVVAALIARLVASDWSTALALLGALSVVAGPVCAARAGGLSRYVSGMYALQAGFLLVGVSLFSRAGLESASLCLLAAPVAITATMMACGTLTELSGSGDFDRHPLSPGAARAAFAALLLSGMSLAGLPPMDGFVAKALTALSSLGRAAVAPLYALLAAAALAGAAIAVVALARMLRGVFDAAGEPLPGRRPTAFEGLAPLAACGASAMLGLFPGLLLRNFVAGGSRLLFRTGFAGPGVVFRGSGVVMERAISYYANWSETAAAFLFTVAVFALAGYFLSGARRSGRVEAKADGARE